MHSPMSSDNANGLFLNSVSYFTAPCIGLFFMVSGALLLPVKTDYVTFIKKRFSKIVVPTLVWSLIYIALAFDGDNGLSDIVRKIASMPFSAQGNGVLWFMYTLAGLYLVAPILSPWLEKASKRELQIVLGIWCVTLCYPLLDFFVATNATTTGILYYFTGYAGYFVLGYYLRKYPDSVSLPVAGLISASGVVLLLALKYFRIEFDFYTLFWYESIFIVSLAVAIWKLVDRMQIKHLPQALVTLSNLSFGIYLVHILVMRNFLWHQDFILNISNYQLQSIVVAFVTFVLSWIACWLISLMPFSKWIVGCHTSLSKY